MNRRWTSQETHTLEARVAFLKALEAVRPPACDMTLPALLRKALSPGWKSLSSEERRQKATIALRRYHLESDWMIRVLVYSADRWTPTEKGERDKPTFSLRMLRPSW